MTFEAPRIGPGIGDVARRAVKRAADSGRRLGVRFLIVIAAVDAALLLSRLAAAQVVHFQEAEKCRIVWGRKEAQFDNTSFASGGRLVVWWGFTKNDSCEWDVDLKAPLTSG